MQDVYNGIGIVLANRENNSEALPYLNSSIESYEAAIAACKQEDKLSLFADKMQPIDKWLLMREAGMSMSEE